MPVEAAQRGDDVFHSAATAAAVAPHHGMQLGVLQQLADVGRGDLVEPALGPLIEDAVPVGAVRAAGAVADRGADLRDVDGEGRRGGARRGRADQVFSGDAHAVEQQPGCVEIGLPNLRRLHEPPPVASAAPFELGRNSSSRLAGG